MPLPHYSHGHEVDPAAEQALREWALAHEDDPDPEAAEFAPLPRPGEHDLLRPLHSIEDYSAWQGTTPERPAR